MQKHDNLFTPSEATVLTGLPLKAVNNAIDKKTLCAVPGDKGERLLDARALVSLSIERRLSPGAATPELRRKVFDALASAPRNALLLEDGFIKVDLRGPRRAFAASLRDLRRARRMVVSDPEILGGDPVLRGTRVPVHLVAQRITQGNRSAELIKSYPRLSAEMIGLGQSMPAYPLRGPKRKLPWHDQQPVRRGRRKLERHRGVA